MFPHQQQQQQLDFFGQPKQQLDFFGQPLPPQQGFLGQPLPQQGLLGQRICPICHLEILPSDRFFHSVSAILTITRIAFKI